MGLWWEAPDTPVWVCPNCGEANPPGDWREGAVTCEDCGTHEARWCPSCGAAFDHVWGAKKIRDATVQKGGAGEDG